MGEKLSIFAVAPRVGAWIEILTKEPDVGTDVVAPRVGAWIEIIVFKPTGGFGIVAPRVGAWIEISPSILITS